MSKTLLLMILIAFLIVINFLFIFNSDDSGDSPLSNAAGLNKNVFSASQAYVFPLAESNYMPLLNSGFARPIINAKSAVLYDLRAERALYENNTKQKLPVASLTKILSAVIALENLDLADIVIIPQEALRVDEEKQTLYLDERLTVENLLKLMLIESSNDSAKALALYAGEKGIDFTAKMNEKAFALGMVDSFFLDTAGLNDEAYSTVEDLVKLVKYALKYELIWDILAKKNVIIKSEDGRIEHQVKSTNQLFGVLPDIFGGKTGYTDGALGCMILVVDIPGENDKIISVVLGSSDRFGDTAKLINWAKAAWRWE